MFDLGWTELLLIGIVALIVVGPKDLPGMFRTVGNFVGKAKRMAREFSQAMNDAADEAGVTDLQKTLNAATKPMTTAMNEVKKSTASFTQSTRDAGKPKATPEADKPFPKDTAAPEPPAIEATPPAAGKPAKAAKPAKTPTKTATKTAKTTAKKPAAKAPAKTAAAKTATKTATKTAAKPTAKSAAKPGPKPAAKKPAARKAPAKKPAAKTDKGDA